jgi:hypothetical protein
MRSQNTWLVGGTELSTDSLKYDLLSGVSKQVLDIAVSISLAL